MWDYGYNEKAVVNLRDSVPGVVRCRLPAGTKVLCSIKRQAERNKDILVSIDSTIYEDNAKTVA